MACTRDGEVLLSPKNTSIIVLILKCQRFQRNYNVLISRHTKNLLSDNNQSPANTDLYSLQGPTADMGTNMTELQALLVKKDARIRELEVENMSLRSQLDKYQSVFSVPDLSSSTGAAPAAAGKNNRKIARGVGISAEPQSLKSLQDLTAKTFPSYKKSDKAQELIRGAIMDNDFMKHLETSQIKVSWAVRQCAALLLHSQNFAIYLMSCLPAGNS